MTPRPPDRVLDLAALDAPTLSAWERLSEVSGCGYFSGPVWATSWYDSFGAGQDCRVALWDGPDGLAGVAPMVRVAEPVVPGRLGDRAPLRVWRNLGSGLGGADHLGLPCAPGLREDALAWALARPGTVRLEHLGAAWAVPLARHGVRAPARTRTYAVDMSSGPTPGSKKLWKHIARSRRHLVADGVEFDHLWGDAVDRGQLEQLFSLHGVRSERAGRHTTFTAARLDFHERLASRSTTVHTSFMVRARLRGRLIGALYGFAGPDRLHYYQSGWDPEHEKASLGSILIGEAIALAVDRDAAVFDFLRGDEPYKLRFGAEVVEDLTVFVPRGATGAVLRVRDRAAAVAATRRSRAE